ncbi:MAG: T9SS type A sorting domain-containing protein, partial [Prevotellaceae bacterium]|jgi:hypothetical protein|nr:T9SS type A sorting domain-containing protein [Prevotellaceae bacterium]
VPSYTYTGVAIEPPLVVTEGANTLTPGQEYTATYAGNVDAGTASATVTITGAGNYSGSASTATTFLITPRDINEASVAAIPDQTYTGAAVTPAPALAITDGHTLVENTDYTVNYNDNTLIGTATVTITGINNYTATRQTSFNISRKSIADADITVAPIPDQTYTGAAIAPPVVVVYGASTLTGLTDYTTGYTNNVNVGTAKVTITGAGNYSGAIDVTFDILEANQTIIFPDIPDLLLINGPYTLQATATSGLPVTYTSSNTAIADIGNDGVTLLLKDFGAVTITATQQGNNNYNPAPSVQRQVNVVESGNTAANVTVIGAKFDAVNSRYVMNCSENSVTVIVEPEDYTARVYYNNALGNVFAVTVPTGVQGITYTVKSGANEHTYPLEIAKPFKFDDVVKMRWDNTLTVINNPANNGGFHFTSFAWYGDGRLITANQSFSAGNTGQTIDPAITYHVVLEADEYTGALSTCPSLVELRHSAADMVAYPNPAQSNGLIFVEINMDEAQLDHAEIEIFNIVGVSMGKVRVAGQITPVNMSSLPTGMYLLNLRGKNNLNKTVKVVLQ